MSRTASIAITLALAVSVVLASAVPALAALPTAVTDPATTPDQGRSWLFHGTLNGQNLPTHFHFGYYLSGKDTSPVMTTPEQDAATDLNNQAVSAPDPPPIGYGLSTYFRLVVTNTDGSTSGDYLKFVAPVEFAPVPPCGTFWGGPCPLPTPPSFASAICVVPRLKGRTVRRARRLLAAANCQVGGVRTKRPTRHGKRHVNGTNPPAKSHSTGGPVDLYVS